MAVVVDVVSRPLVDKSLKDGFTCSCHCKVHFLTVSHRGSSSIDASDVRLFY